ncbi:MAG: hypothetical protein H7Z75_02375 [Ferruginibacter sp.]|nr:hypothetical protein [Cytophagales bacterium]
MRATQKVLFCLFLLAGSSWLAACKKDQDPGPAIVGTWVGQYGFRDQAAGNGYKFYVRDGGDFGVSTDTTDITPAGQGTWNLTGTAFRATYIYATGGTFSVLGTLNGNTLDGSWGDGSQNDNRGRFLVRKK